MTWLEINEPSRRRLYVKVKCMKIMMDAVKKEIL
jgi:hypothetical protein